MKTIIPTTHGQARYRAYGKLCAIKEIINNQFTDLHHYSKEDWTEYQIITDRIDYLINKILPIGWR